MSGEPDDSKAGEATFLILAWIIGIFVISLTVDLIAGAVAPASTSQPPQCSTSCSLFLRWECPGNRFIGACFGVSACDQPVHECGKNPP